MLGLTTPAAIASGITSTLMVFESVFSDPIDVRSLRASLTWFSPLFRDSSGRLSSFIENSSSLIASSVFESVAAADERCWF